MVTMVGDIFNNEKQMVDSTAIQQLNIMEYVYIDIGTEGSIIPNCIQTKIC